ncbi:hypothetical protein F9U64_01880 [Gracilibacillus oryzae]|uniref:HTH cro/C1-type domain-containing protein n=1 Tax=Gracilibacillus oryzae TaxID=1672701 RepID=A0A7C8GVI5_9BACI|nr:hypothetical protein [Gracilibacillus oryzae]KAB8139163.1 hypothetical protein F9U64_01880 [Gracilibacillus oryzae]
MNSEVSKVMIGNQLQHLLEINGFNISGDILLEDLGFNRLTLQKYLSNAERPTLEEIVQHAKFFNTSVDYIVGNSGYVLDTWDFNFLEEFFQYSSKKIKDHFEDRHNTQIPNEDNLEPILFGLLTYMTLSRTGRSFEDLTEEEIANKKDTFAEIISLFHSCITMSNQDCFDIKELRDLNKNIVDYLFGDFSFAKEGS